MKGKITTTEEAAVHVKELDTLISVHLLEDSTTVRLEDHAKNMGTPTNGEKTTPTSTQFGNFCISIRKFLCQTLCLELLSTRVPAVVPIQHREQGVIDWLQPFPRGRVDGDLGSSSSAGETIPKTPPPHSPARLKQKPDSAVQDKKPQRYLIGSALNAGGRLETRPCASTQKIRYPEPRCSWSSSH